MHDLNTRNPINGAVGVIPTPPPIKHKGAMKRDYYGIEKQPWDELWHALFFTEGHREGYDRVTKRKARAIARRLFKNHVRFDRIKK